jgi:hypothetical protein
MPEPEIDEGGNIVSSMVLTVSKHAVKASCHNDSATAGTVPACYGGKMIK